MTKASEAKALYDQATLIALKKKPYRKATIALLKQAVDLGSNEAARALGDWARRGVGGKRDPKLAAAYFRKAAELGSALGAHEFAHCLEFGFGLRKNASRARRAYLLASLLGDEHAPFELRRCLFFGIGGEPDAQLAEALGRHFTALGRFSDLSKQRKNKKR